MKRKFSIALFLIGFVSSFASMAQDSRLSLGINGGLSMPSGNFTKTDYSNPASGFAGAGYNLGINGWWKAGKHWGINALVSYHAYSIQGLQNLADGYHNDFAVDSSTISSTGNNYSINVLAGPYYSLPLAKRLSLDGRILAGMTNAHLAGYNVYLEDNTDASFGQKTASATSFATQAGLALRYQLTKQWALALNGDYFYSRPDFTISNTNRANNAGRLISSYNEPITAMNINLTLAYTMIH